MLRAALLILAAAVAGFAGYVALQPADFAVARSITIKAPPSAVFAHVNNLKKWPAWSPWAGRDPNAKESYAGPDAGAGAQFDWAGNAEIGAGSIKIKDTTPPSQILIDLSITEPFMREDLITFTFDRADAGTEVRWQLSGTHSFTERAIMTAMLLDLDTVVGTDYARGLKALKEVAEKEVAEAAAASEQQADVTNEETDAAAQ